MHTSHTLLWWHTYARLVETPTLSDFTILTRPNLQFSGLYVMLLSMMKVLQRGSYCQMQVRLDMELEVLTDLSLSELASKMAVVVQEVIGSMKQSSNSEVEFDILLLLDGHEMRFVMEPV